MKRTIREYVGIYEMMDILEITREHVYRLMKNDPAFPESYQFPRSTTIKIWNRAEIEEYAKKRNRKRGPRR